MRGRSRRSSAFSRGPRRKLVWATTNGTVVVPAASTLEVVDLLAPLRTTGSSVLGVTVMRTIINIYQTTAVTTGDVFSYGVIVTNAPTTTTTPNPNTAVELDWMFIDTRVATKSDNFPTFGNKNDSQWIYQDIRSKRKVEEMGESLVLALNPAISAVVPVDYNVFARVLLALP